MGTMPLRPSGGVVYILTFYTLVPQSFLPPIVNLSSVVASQLLNEEGHILVTGDSTSIASIGSSGLIVYHPKLIICHSGLLICHSWLIILRCGLLSPICLPAILDI